MTSQTHLLTQLPRRTIKQELICSKASFVDRVRTLKLFQYFQTASWSHWWVRHAGTSARSPPGDGGETKLQPLLLQKKRKMYNLTLRSLKREKSSCTWHFPARAGSYCEKTGVCTNFGTCIHLWAIFMTYEIICCTNYTDLTETMEFEHGFHCSGIYLHDITEGTFIKAQMQHWSTSVGNTGSGL